ncbi:PEP-CTERM sorting domain-containing protein [Undibacterium parvum]|uniref:PEP-CTERM sorting domain-containing protein n=3 Tax=Undibacterium TaxID=401469 RepID=A0A6M4AE63_9BURK|nr:PEP-CTERM sorting domain-containing protein [Undibacterium parvum]QJQ07819.1 PEP-CTERM sorting domain-containing protein [Undibacterium piscinae]
MKFSLSNVVAYNAIPAIPEPSSYAMLLGGLGLFGFLARRRQKTNSFQM